MANVFMFLKNKAIKASFFILLLFVLIGGGARVYCTNGNPPKALLPQAHHIIVEKSKRQLHLMGAEGNLIKTYPIALGFAPLGAKVQEGDGKTPEGQYTISGKNPRSQFHLSLRVSYPSPQDKREAQKLGVSPGGDIMIHGLGRSFSFLGTAHRLRDWTLGCIAVTNEEIEEIYATVNVGATISIVP